MDLISGTGVSIDDYPYDPSAPFYDRTVFYRKEVKKKTSYLVFLEVSGRDVQYVKSVTYRFHSSVVPSVVTIDRTPSNPTCKISAWLHSKFVVKVEITDLRGVRYFLSHMLTYDTKFDVVGDKFKAA